MKIEVVLTEAEIAQELIESMQARDVPEKFFYWLPRSARAWNALAQESGLYVDLNRSWKEPIQRAAELAPRRGDGVAVVSFGAGDGIKDRAIVRSLQDAGIPTKYFPVDASQPLLETACAGAEDEDFDVVGIKADISSPPHLIFAADAADGARLFLMAGATLGGFDPLSEVRALAQCMGPGDRLLIDGEFRKDDSLERRNHPAILKFVFSPLAAVGVNEDDGEIRFEEKRDERHAGLYMITRHFRTAHDVRTMVTGEEVSIQKGERIALNFQYVFTEEGFRWLVEKHAGLKIVQQFPSPTGRFFTVLCER
jgi:uncharacterized SAM-dependent methyltransferase